MAEAIVGMDLADLRELLGPDQPAYRAKQIYEAVYRTQTYDVARMAALPARMREELAGRVAMGLPEVAQRYESADGTRRYLMRLEDRRTVETVLMPEGARDTLCISSQVGCPADCKFCMTALLGLERNLTAGEIVGQVLLVACDNRLRRDGARRGRGDRVSSRVGANVRGVTAVQVMLQPRSENGQRLSTGFRCAKA